MKKSDQSRYQTVNEDRIVRIWLILIVLGLLLIYLIYYHIKYDLPANTMLGVMSYFNKLSVFIYLMLALLLLELIRWRLYKRSIRTIMLNGTSCAGTVIDAVGIPKAMRGYVTYSDHWKYKVRLPDGSIVLTEQYTNNFYYDLVSRTCTVYEYNGKYYFTDFA